MYINLYSPINGSQKNIVTQNINLNKANTEKKQTMTNLDTQHAKHVMLSTI